ncbi:hypothetical protein ACSL9E_004198 [Vibrio vulnificus]
MDKKSATDIAKDTFEFTLDQVTNNEFVKDIPIVNMVANVVSLSRSIPDYLFARKLNKFLNCLDDVSYEDRKRLKARAVDDNKIDSLAELILNCLQKANDEKKAEFIACLFLAYADGVIDEVGFRRALDVTDIIFIDDLIYFAKHFDSIKDAELYEENISNQCPSIVGSVLIQRRSAQRERYSSERKRLLSSPVLEVELSVFGQEVIDAYSHGMKLRCSK